MNYQQAINILGLKDNFTKNEIKFMVENLNLNPKLLKYFNNLLDTIINQEK